VTSPRSGIKIDPTEDCEVGGNGGGA